MTNTLRQHIDRWTHVLHITLRWTVVFTVIAVAVPVVIFGASFARIVSGFSGTATLPVDCAIVFGNAVGPSGIPGPGIERRVDTAARLVNEGRVKRIIVSGGLTPGYKVSEAQAMRDVAIKDGVPESAVIMEDRARSTLENLAFSQPLAADCQGTIGISDRYHLARIRLLARRLDWKDLETYPADELPTKQSEWRSFVRETLAYTFYWLHIDGILPLAPSAL